MFNFYAVLICLKLCSFAPNIFVLKIVFQMVRSLPGIEVGHDGGLVDDGGGHQLAGVGHVVFTLPQFQPVRPVALDNKQSSGYLMMVVFISWLVLDMLSLPCHSSSLSDLCP